MDGNGSVQHELEQPAPLEHSISRSLTFRQSWPLENILNIDLCVAIELHTLSTVIMKLRSCIRIWVASLDLENRIRMGRAFAGRRS